jgi:hypothetical protein
MVGGTEKAGKIQRVFVPRGKNGAATVGQNQHTKE